MATVAPASPARTKFDARVEAELARTVGRIRANDLLLGVLAAATLALAYTVGMVLLDRWLNLSMPARQAALGGFAVALGLVGWRFLVRPLRRSVNPRYAARRVEATLADDKNTLINWVDLRDRDLPPTVRAAVGQRAAGDLQAADVARATEAKPVIWLAAAAGLLAATLGLLFVALKPAPFTSLVKRTFNPFVAREIATRTTLALTEPAGGDTTVTAGDSLTVAVDVGGSVPDADGPTRVRLQVWHTDGQAEVDELPLEPGPGNDWRLTVPPSVIQNGFWYRVVGGDTRTADHRVTVRSRPLVVGYEARYESPAYTRIPVEVGREPKLEGYRGTKVTLTARTNRPVKRGWMAVEGKPDPLPAEVVGDARDSLRFELTLAQNASYRLGFTSATDETSDPTPPFPIRVLSDQPPTLAIGKPAEDEVSLPANGHLAVDGEAADDFGLTGVVLRMRVVGPGPGFTLQPKPYRPGKSFQRADGTFPTRLADADGSQTGYRDTVDLATLKDAAGKPLPFVPDTVIEYWLEATDNCTEPKPNVGQSARKRLRLAPPVTDAPKKQDLDRQAQARQADQQRHEQVQDKQLQNEPRPPKQLRPEDKPPAEQQPGQPGEGQPQEGQPQKGDQRQDGQPQAGGGQQPQKGDKPPSDGAKPDAPKQPADQSSQQTKPDGTGEPQPQPGGTDTPPKGEGKPGEPQGKAEKRPGGTDSKGAAGSKSEPTPDQKKLDEQAAKVQQAIREQGGQQPSEGAPKPREAGTGGQPSPADATAEKERQKGIQQAIDDLNGSDPAKQQAARDKLDKELGQDQRERIERIQKGLKSNDPKEREAARKEMGELDRETGTSSAGIRSDRKEDVERLSRELNADDPGTREHAERQADEQFGPQGREQLKQAGQKLNSQDKQQQEEGKKDVDQLMKKKKDKPKDQPTGGDPQPKGGQKASAADQVRQQAGDLTSKDDARRQAAEQAMDRKIGPEARKDLQQKLGSNDPKQQEAGRQQVEQMAKQAGGGQDGKQPTPDQVKEAADTLRDLNSSDDARRQAAEQKLDRQIGPDQRRQLQQDLKDLQSGDKDKRQAAEQRLRQAADQTAGGGEKKPADPQQPKGAGPSKEEIDRAAEAARDLTSPDADKRRAAEEKLDQQIGSDKRKELQQQLDAMKNGTPEQQAAAAKKLEQMAKDAAKQTGQQPPSPEQMKELADAAKDLTSSDPDKKRAAEEKLDKAIGPKAREQVQKEQAAKQPDPKATRDATEQAMRDAKGEKQPKVDPAEAEKKAKELAEAAKDLNSPDQATREAAEKKLDDQLGPEARKQMQQLQKDLQSPDQKTREAAQRRLQEAMDQLKGKFDPKRFKPGGGSTGDTEPGKEFKDDPANRLKTAELQLETFKKYKGDKKLLEKTGMTDAEYERFLAEMERRLAQLRQEAAKPKAGAAAKAADGPVTVKVGEGAGQVEKKDNGPATGGGVAGKSAPGYGEAQKRFAAQAAKGGKKPADAPAPAPKQP